MPHGPQLPLSTTHDALAVSFACVHRARLRYVAEWKRWMAWDGRSWRPDKTLLATDLARAVCGREAAAVREAEPPEIAARVVHRLGNVATPAAVERLARSDRALVADAGQWDRDPDLLNTQAGIVDTRTGNLLPHRGDAYMTRITATAPAAPGTPHPLWSGFLDRVTGGDADLAFYLQRLAGYALTGHNTEHALFFAHGTGANGKSTFVGTLARILGNYADAASLDMLAAGSARGCAAERARLAGVRLVLVQDTWDGRSWPASRIEALTGGDQLVAGDARRGLGAMTPGFKLLIAGTERPRLSRVDEALRRRLQLIPFGITVPEAERDRDLARRLEAEYPAILRRAIAGALAWRRIGLDPPEAVRAAGEHHLAGEDTVGQWLEDCAVRSSSVWSSSAALHGRWTSWCRAAGEPPGSRKRFSQTLEARGLIPRRRHGGVRGFLGIELRDEAAILSDTLRAAMDEIVGHASPVFARGASAAVAPETARAMADCCTASFGAASQQGELGPANGALGEQDASPRVTASKPLPAPFDKRSAGGRECAPLRRELRSARVRAGTEDHKGKARLPKTPSLAFTPPPAERLSKGAGEETEFESTREVVGSHASPRVTSLRSAWASPPLPCSDLFPSWPKRPYAPNPSSTILPLALPLSPENTVR